MRLFSRNKKSSNTKSKDSVSSSIYQNNSANINTTNNSNDSQTLLQNLYLNNWIAAKIIDIPVDDSFIYHRKITNLDIDQSKLINDLYKEFSLDQKIKKIAKSARLFGSALMLLIFDDNKESNTPVNTNAKLLNIVEIDKYSVQEVTTVSDIKSRQFNKPFSYLISNNTSHQSIEFHHSRVIQVDASENLTFTNLMYKDKHFGLSILKRPLEVIDQYKAIIDSTIYLLKESSIPILKIPDLQDALAGAQDAFEDQGMTIDKFVSRINSLKSVFTTTCIDAKMDLTRLNVNFAQIPELIEKFLLQISAVSDIPQTRFFGKSPQGFNSTGSSEMKNYANHISSLQNKLIKPIYERLDSIFLAQTNIKQQIEFTFPTILNELTETEKADIMFKKSQAYQIYMNNGVYDEDEVKEMLDNQ